MSESGDYTQSHYPQHDFNAARALYDQHAGRSFDDAKTSGKNLDDVRPKSISSLSRHVVFMGIDVTGSNKGNPEPFFVKSPYLAHEAKTEYFGDDVEFCFGAIGDANGRTFGDNYGDKYPLQIRPFIGAEDVDATKARVEELINEGGGGGQTHENYELYLLYLLHNAKIPNALKPLIIIYGDESPYEQINLQQAKDIACVELHEGITTEALFEELCRRFSIYFIQAPYNNDGGFENPSSTTKRVYDDWVRLIGADHVAQMLDRNRLVDVVFGIFGQETGKVDYFYEEIKGRQSKAQVAAASKALATIHSAHMLAKTTTGCSQSHMPVQGRPMRKLLDD